MFFRPRIVMAPAEEISGGNAPEVKANHSEIYESGDPNETFDNLEYESEASKKAGESLKDRVKKSKETKKLEVEEEDEEEESEEKPKKKKEEKPKEDKKKKSDIDTLSDKQDGVDDEEEKPKKSKKDEEEEESEEEDESEEEEEEKPIDKEKKGKIKVRQEDGQLYGLDAETKVRYKVDGEWVEKPLQEVLNKASGVEALDKKFTEYGQKNKDLQAREAQLTRTTDVLKNLVGEIRGILDNPEKNPMDAILSLVEKSGGDVYNAERRLLEANLETLEKLMEMSESERKAFWLERKDAIRTKADENRRTAFEKQQSLTQATQKLDSLRQTLGVSEEQFNQAYDELEEAGELDKYTNEQIVEYASMKPHIESVRDVLEAHEDKIKDSEYEEIVQDFAKQLRNKKLTLEQLKAIVKKEFMDEDLKDLATREKKKAPAKKATSKDDEPKKREYESFEDFDD